MTGATGTAALAEAAAARRPITIAGVEYRTPGDPTALAALRVPFPPEQVGTLPGRGGSKPLSYVGHAALTARLLDVDPLWTWEPFALDATGLPAFDANGNLWIRLTVCGHTRIGVGDSGNGKGAKEAIGDALRNAAMRFGAALDLWSKEDLQAQAQAHAAAPPPPHIARVFAVVGRLSAEQKASLREWYDRQGFPDLKELDEDQSVTVCDYAESIIAWPDTSNVDPHTGEVKQA